MGITVVQRGKSWRAVVRIGKAKALTKTCATEKEARVWGTQTEAAAIIAGPGISRGKSSLGFVLEKARLAEEAKPYRSGSLELLRRLHLEIGHIDLADCTADFWRKTMLAWDVSPSTRGTYVARIRSALVTAEALWDIKVNWEGLRTAVTKLKKANPPLIAKSKPRKRRVTDAEIALLKRTAQSYTGKIPFADVVDFAVATCMRQGEIFRITWEDLNFIRGNPMQNIRDRKDPSEKVGNDQNIPLLGEAYKIIKRQPKRLLKNGETDARIFPFNRMAFCALFGVIARKAKIKNLHFHDLRHEGISRLFEAGFGIPEVCNVSGHSNWETLKDYTHISGDRMHEGPISQQQQKPQRHLYSVA